MKRIVMVGLCCVCAAACADDLVITSYSGNGEVEWTYPTNDVKEYRAEWASALHPDEWTDVRCGIQGISPTGSSMTASAPMFCRIVALGNPPEGMVYIPAGRFEMGDTFGEGGNAERPVHDVYVSGFYMDRTEVSKDLWDEVATWATGHSYDIQTTDAAGKATNHPAQSVDWYEAVKWCNARSQMEDLEPVYYIDPIFFNAYKTGDVDVDSAWVKWEADGYRLPTEAEWEKAARGGCAGHRFPWPDDTISHGRANYYATGVPYDLSTDGLHPLYDDEVDPSTSPVGAFTANGYGLYDMAGNVVEWTWDWFGADYYAASQLKDPRGPTTGDHRVHRGGAAGYVGSNQRCARRIDYPPYGTSSSVGFRTVRGR